MSDLPQHIIKRQLLELLDVHEPDAHQLQQEVKRIYEQKILPLLDAYLTRLSPNGALFRINQLELNLGKVRINHLEEDILGAIREQLRVRFEPMIQSRQEEQIRTKARDQLKDDAERTKGLSRKMKPGDAQFELLNYFVKYGSLPWWADATNPNLLKDSLRHLILNHDQRLIRAMNNWGQRTGLLKRIVRQLGYPLWVELAALNINMNQEEFKAMFAELMLVLHKIEPWKKRSLRSLQENIGMKSLAWIYLQSGPLMDAPTFWKGFLMQLAVSEKEDFGQLLADLDEEFAKMKGGTKTGSSHLSALISQFWKEQNRQPSVHFADLADRLEAIIKYKPLASDLKTRLKEALAQLTVAATDSSKLQEIEAWLKQIEADSDFQETLRKRVGALLKTGILSEEWETRLKSVWQQLSAPLLNRDSLQVIFNLIIQAETMQQEQSLEPEGESNSFSGGDELFVANAGLVILWPFIGRFFDNLGLTDNKAFADKNSAHRAVGLLQFLADGQPEPMEYHCGLNKILCGLPWDVVLDFGEPVTESEAAECENLLQAVIAHAPILGEMSVDGFRGTFLLRKGILRSGQGAWQLHVERESYDVVLEQFPWNWNHVKLPWMEWGMEVVW